MCLILLAWQTHPDYPLVVAANRDEFFDRPAAPAAFWPEAPDLFAGRDLQAGGAWLGVTRQGRFAALTNYRNGKEAPRNDAPSRGALVADFLNSGEMPKNYLQRIQTTAQEYNGFNLLVGDLGAGKRTTGNAPQLGYLSNRAPTEGGMNGTGDTDDTSEIRRMALPPGIYGLSNHLLDTPWPKLSTAKTAFARALARLPENPPPDFPETTAFFDLLADAETAPDARLPRTGIPLARERMLSAIFVKSPDYGTRASTVLICRREHRRDEEPESAPTLRMCFIERSFGRNAEMTGEIREAFCSVSPVDIALERYLEA